MDRHIEILIVEDSRTQAVRLQYLLEKHDYGVRSDHHGHHYA